MELAAFKYLLIYTMRARHDSFSPEVAFLLQETAESVAQIFGNDSLLPWSKLRSRQRGSDSFSV